MTALILIQRLHREWQAVGARAPLRLAPERAARPAPALPPGLDPRLLDLRVDMLSAHPRCFAWVISHPAQGGACELVRSEASYRSAYDAMTDGLRALRLAAR